MCVVAQHLVQLILARLDRDPDPAFMIFSVPLLPVLKRARHRKEVIDFQKWQWRRHRGTCSFLPQRNPQRSRAPCRVQCRTFICGAYCSTGTRITRAPLACTKLPCSRSQNWNLYGSVGTWTQIQGKRNWSFRQFPALFHSSPKLKSVS